MWPGAARRPRSPGCAWLSGRENRWGRARWCAWSPSAFGAAVAACFEQGGFEFAEPLSQPIGGFIVSERPEPRQPKLTIDIVGMHRGEVRVNAAAEFLKARGRERIRI